MNKIFSRNTAAPFSEEDLHRIVETEWLVTNGLGGYASGSIGGTLTRVFHGYLIAALPAPLGRTMMLNEVLEEVIFPDGRCVALNGLLRQEEDERARARHLAGFSFEGGLPIWTYEFEGVTLEKKVVLPHHQNTVYVNYRLTHGSEPVKLRLRPAVNMREHEAPVNSPIDGYTLTIREDRYELKNDDGLPPLRLTVLGEGVSFSMDALRIADVIYEMERSRGYIWRGDLWSPGYFSIDIDVAREATLTASTEPWNVMLALSPAHAWNSEQDRKRRLLVEANSKARDACPELIWAADQFVFTPVGRPEDAARARAAGDEIRSIIAGYHWFTDWGRDTMISLEGLTLVSGRRGEASYILRTFAHYIRDGLVPNLFPEGKSEGLYHTADATLWFFHAYSRYLHYGDDPHLQTYLLPHLIDIIGHHLRGTKFNIHVDHEDGLLVQGQKGYQLTWMDAKCGDWVVTPRRGKAVEINALWYNALRLLEDWLRAAGRDNEADDIATHAARARDSFNRRFWNEADGCLYDVVDGENGPVDSRCRPNQIFAISLEHPVLHPSKWEPVLKTVKDKLLTPVGLRSLAPGDPDYKPRYDGDLRSRDAAYHQGTVWAWLIGPFIDAWLKVYQGDIKTARGFLKRLETHLQSACVGSISEIFDAEEPFSPRGCCAQAWSVAEVLRAFVKTTL
jgi:predicted glycogen debranching enzyme